jgi:hypothetical protein
MRENNPKSDFLITPCQKTNPRQKFQENLKNSRPHKGKIPQEVIIQMSEVPLCL